MTAFGNSPTPYDVDPRRWERTLRDVAAAMVASGWPPKASKFREVQQRRALRIFWTAK